MTQFSVVRPPTLLLDGGFASNALWGTLAEHGIDVLCPSGCTDSDGDWPKRSSRPGKFTKREFHYDHTRDVYCCPAGRELSFAYQEQDAFGPATASIGAEATARAVHCVVNALIHRAVASSNAMTARILENGWQRCSSIRWRVLDTGGAK